jgi:hypothetical protein
VWGKRLFVGLRVTGRARDKIKKDFINSIFFPAASLVNVFSNFSLGGAKLSLNSREITNLEKK